MPPPNHAPLRRALIRWFASNARDLPWRRTRDPYAILVSEFMLQQTTVTAVISYFDRWMQRFPDFAALARARPASVLRAWEGLGYYSRARNLHRLAKIVVSEHGGTLPRDLDSLARLPGIGPYTLGAVGSFAFDLRLPAIDTNVARVIARLTNLQTAIDTKEGASAVIEFANALLPRGRGSGRVNSALMELGALICTAREPNCAACPARQWCRAKEPHLLPRKRSRRPTIAIEEHRAWIVRWGKILLEQSNGPRWQGMWLLPSLPSALDAKSSVLLATRYAITHHLVRLFIHTAPAPRRTPRYHKWFGLSQLAALPVAAPHRKVISLLGRSLDR